MNGIELPDIVIILSYLALIMVVGFYFSHRREETTTDYFLAGRKVGWIAIGASLFATNISSEHFIGLAGFGAIKGLAIGNFEWLAIIFIMLLGWFFAPIFIKSKVFTLPEFLGQRYNQTTRLYLSAISIVAYIFTKVSVTLFAGGLLMEKLLGIDIYTSAVLMVVITGIYTIVGGLGAVIYTSVIQAVFLVAGAVVLTALGLQEVGGLAGLQEKLPHSYFSFFHPSSDPDIPWTGIIFGAPILAIWYWCTDQYIVQRIFCAKNVNAARNGAVFAGFLKILPVFVLVLPGLIAAVIFPGIQGDQAYPTLLASSILPVGLRGLVLAGLLAALMSSLASCFNSTATLFTMDFYRHFKPQASQRKLVLIGRLTTTVMVITAILWIPLIKLISSNFYLRMQSIQSYISPPIAAVFLLAIFWKRANGKGAIFGLIVGGLLGGVRLIHEFINPSDVINNSLIAMIIEVNHLHFAFILFFISIVTTVIVSVASQKTSVKKITEFKFRWNDLVTPSFVSGPERAGITVHKSTLFFSVILFLVLFGLWGRLLF